MKRLPFLALLLLVGCFATAQPFYLPDGSKGYRLDCSQYMGGVSDCLQKAGDICGSNGYQMYDQTGRLINEDSELQSVISTVNNSATKKTAAARSLHASSTPDAPGKSMFIKCRTNEMPTHLRPASLPAVEAAPTAASTKPASGKPVPLHDSGGQ